jgi:hypothetical protein
MPSGAVGACGSSPSFAATAFVGSVWMSLPSRKTVPDAGVSSRASPRSRVDLPQALAPTMTVIRPVGMPTVRSVTTDRVP